MALHSVYCSTCCFVACNAMSRRPFTTPGSVSPLAVRCITQAFPNLFSCAVGRSPFFTITNNAAWNTLFMRHCTYRKHFSGTAMERLDGWVKVCAHISSCFLTWLNQFNCRRVWDYPFPHHHQQVIWSSLASLLIWVKSGMWLFYHAFLWCRKCKGQPRVVRVRWEAETKTRCVPEVD